MSMPAGRWRNEFQPAWRSLITCYRGPVDLVSGATIYQGSAEVIARYRFPLELCWSRADFQQHKSDCSNRCFIIRLPSENVPNSHRPAPSTRAAIEGDEIRMVHIFVCAIESRDNCNLGLNSNSNAVNSSSVAGDVAGVGTTIVVPGPPLRSSAWFAKATVSSLWESHCRNNCNRRVGHRGQSASH